MKDPHGRCFLVQFSAFAASHIDASKYPPPYFLRGTFCNSSIESSLSSVEGTPSWELCHQFEFKETHNVMDQQMVIECYSTDETNFIGMCCVLPDQLLQLVESSSCVVNNFPLTLQLYNGAQVEGKLSFHVTMETIILFTLIITRVALIPHPPPGSSLCVEISCGFEEIDGHSVSVKSEYVPREISEWTEIPHLHCKTTLTALEKDGVSLVFIDEIGEVMTHLRIAVPMRISSSTTTIMTRVNDMERYGLNVNMPVEFVGMDATLHCILSGETVIIEPQWKRQSQSSVAVSCDVIEKEEKEKEKEENQNKWKNDENNKVQTFSTVNHMTFTEDLCILGEVLKRQEEMLVTIHERLEFVRKSKAEVLSKLESLHHMAEAAAKDPNILRRNIEIESELQACMRKRRRLKSELALVQQQYTDVTLNHARQSEERTQELEKLKMEHRAISHVREYTQKVQERMIQDGLSEQKRREERQEQAKEQESLTCNAAETLAVVERLLRELQL